MIDRSQVVIYCPNTHPAYKYWLNFCLDNDLSIISEVENIRPCEYLFLISCTTLLSPEKTKDIGLVCVVHESDLPKGRGWSPLAWQILEGKSEIVVSAIACAEKVDSGDILAQRILKLDGSELSDEINKKAFLAKAFLVLDVINHPNQRPQVGCPTYYPKRTPKDSRLDPDKSIREQFNLLRVCEDRFPAFFDLNDHTYEVRLRRVT
jgi:methionyl-tRNA formyltransferase